MGSQLRFNRTMSFQAGLFACMESKIEELDVLDPKICESPNFLLKIA